MKQYIPRQNDWKRLFGSWNACLILFFMTALVGAQENFDYNAHDARRTYHALQKPG